LGHSKSDTTTRGGSATGFGASSYRKGTKERSSLLYNE